MVCCVKYTIYQRILYIYTIKHVSNILYIYINYVVLHTYEYTHDINKFICYASTYIFGFVFVFWLKFYTNILLTKNTSNKHIHINYLSLFLNNIHIIQNIGISDH